MVRPLRGDGLHFPADKEINSALGGGLLGLHNSFTFPLSPGDKPTSLSTLQAANQEGRKESIPGPEGTIANS